MTRESNQQQPKENKHSKLGIGLALGLGAGTALGVALGNIALGIAIGLAIGVSVGTALDQENDPALYQHRYRNILLICLILGLVMLVLIVGILFFMRW